MIKVALKHWIYDYCINLLFDTIKINFSVSSVSIDKRNIKIGDNFRSIEVYSDIKKYRYIYCNCIILNKEMRYSYKGAPKDYISVSSNYKMIINKENEEVGSRDFLPFGSSIIIAIDEIVRIGK
jgi:hypothetical protein